MAQARMPHARQAELSSLEVRCLDLYGGGRTRDEISVIAHVSRRTVGSALTIAKEKLGARNLTHAALMLHTEHKSISQDRVSPLAAISPIF
jgi:DNA-binding CsgD family transcriptional regulator